MFPMDSPTFAACGIRTSEFGCFSAHCPSCGIQITSIALGAPLFMSGQGLIHRACVAAFVTACVVLPSLCNAGIREDVERLVRSAPLRNATVAVSIRDTVTNAPL